MLPNHLRSLRSRGDPRIQGLDWGGFGPSWLLEYDGDSDVGRGGETNLKVVNVRLLCLRRWRVGGKHFKVRAFGRKNCRLNLLSSEREGGVAAGKFDSGA